MQLSPNDHVVYEQIVAVLHDDLAAFAPPLRAVSQPYVDTLVTGEFAQIVALLPHWLNSLLPVAPDVCLQLGVAHLYGWWYASAQDDLLDASAPPSVLLGGHLALLRSVAIYRELGLSPTCWDTMHTLTATSAAAYAQELQSRFQSVAAINDADLSTWNVALLIDRSDAFHFSAVAQMELAGIAADAPLRDDLLMALRCLSAARQISDDATDWAADLRAGQLNYVAAQLIHHARAAHPDTSADLDLERLTGYQIHAEPFWHTVERTHHTLCQQARACLARHEPCRLHDLVCYQLQRDEEYWQEQRRYRTMLRSVFSDRDAV